MSLLHNDRPWHQWTYSELMDARRDLANIWVSSQKGGSDRLYYLKTFASYARKDIQKAKARMRRRDIPNPPAREVLWQLLGESTLLSYADYTVTWDYGGIVDSYPLLNCVSVNDCRRVKTRFKVRACPLWRRLHSNYKVFKRGDYRVIIQKCRVVQHKYEMIEVEGVRHSGGNIKKSYFVFDPHADKAVLYGTMKKAKDAFEADAMARVSSAIKL